MQHPLLKLIVGKEAILETEHLSYPDLLHDLANLWLEAHVQHAISLIQH